MRFFKVHRRISAAILFFAIYSASRLLPWNSGVILFLNTSPSLPRGLYMRIPDSELSIGDYVVYEPPDQVKEILRENGWTSDEDFSFIKRVGALPGETYSIDEYSLRFHAAGVYIGQVVEKDRLGNPMPKLRGEFIVPAGEFLPVTSHPRSFDGRYTGTVPMENIIAKVVPLLVE